MSMRGLWLCGWLVWAGCATETSTVVTPGPSSAPPPPVVAARPKRVPPGLRLPTTVHPTRMEVRATVVPSEKVAPTSVEIGLRLDEQVDHLWLHAKEMELTDARVAFQGGVVSAKARLEGSELALIELDAPIGPGEATLQLDAVVSMSRKEGKGLFVAAEGDDLYAYTHFEPLDARRAFPCFDEPSFKVPWQVTLTVPKDLVALSNTPVEKEEVSGTMKTVTFQRTRPLPSYLVAYAVGPFELVEAGVAGQAKVPVRIVTPKGQGARAKRAAEFTPQVLDRLEAYFAMPYPSAKLDVLAVASSNFGGAMENPGLVTFAQTLLLSSEQMDTVFRQRGLGSTLAHELAHQWFGDLVTMAWWDDLWLNESFASWLEEKVVRAWKPEWKLGLERVSTRSEALYADSLVTARTIRQPITSDDDVLNAFDEITYAKGASVLYMFEQFLGEKAFQAGVRAYLAAHVDGVATAPDFLAALSQAAGREVKPAFDGFLDQPGAPLVTVELRCADKPTVHLSQTRYFAAGATGPAEQWTVPVCLRWPGGSTCELLSEASRDVPLPVSKCPAWVVPNADLAGYYRSRPVSAALLVEPKVTTEERVGLASDLDALVQAGEASVVDELKLVPAWASSEVRAQAAFAAGPLESLAPLMPAAARPKLVAYVQQHYGPRARALGFSAKPKESDEVKLLRPTLLVLVGEAGEDSALLAQAAALAKSWVKTRAGLDPEIITTVLRLAAREGDAALFEALRAAAPTERERRTRGQLYRALGEFLDPAAAATARELALDDRLDAREAMIPLWTQLGHPKTREGAFRFVVEHYDELVKRVPEDDQASLVYFGSALCDAEKVSEVEAFFEPRTTKAPGGPRLYANAMEELRQCLSWRAKQVPAATAFFEKK